MEKCLFCNSEPRQRIFYDTNCITSDKYSVKCNCGAFGHFKDSEEKAKESWNNEACLKYPEGIKRR